MEDSGIIIELRKEPWVSKHAGRKCQDNYFPPAEKKVRTLVPKEGKYGSEDSGVGTSRGTQIRHLVEDRALEDTFLSLSLKEQFLPDGYFRKR